MLLKTSLSCCSNPHKDINIKDYLNLLEGISPPKHECMGIRNAWVI